ncbi:MAG: hypothetical protein GC179_17430 [Anaerolineaceae bacterium]|nr:hypothetical protein [Anaerolineaceae bacterium]
MNGVSAYRRFILRLSLLLVVMIVTASVACLLIGAQSSGRSISAFTTNTQQTTDVWVFDVSRNKFIHLEVAGHDNHIPVWSQTERWIVYYPRSP